MKSSIHAVVAFTYTADSLSGEVWLDSSPSMEALPHGEPLLSGGLARSPSKLSLRHRTTTRTGPLRWLKLQGRLLQRQTQHQVRRTRGVRTSDSLENMENLHLGPPIL